MKSFEQLAQSAYLAYRKQAKKETPSRYVPEWDQMSQDDRNGWTEAAKQLWAEFAAIH